MIKLIFQLRSGAVERVYPHERVVIGLGSEDLADLPLSQSELEAEHLIITEKEGHFWAINHANDPFVTLNDVPFGKKRIKNGDRLIVADIEVIFEGERSQKTLHEMEKKLQRQLDKGREQTEEKSRKNDKKASSHRAMNAESHVQALLEEVEQLAPPKAAKTEKTQAAPLSSLLVEKLDVQTAKKQTGTRPSAPLLEHPSAAESPPSDDSVWKVQPAWRFWSSLLAVVGLVIVLLFGGIYTIFTKQSTTQELSAARSVADIAMALTYAQAHKVKPPNQNWSDPDFLRSNLTRVLDGRFASAADMDAGGYLKNSPYLIRIYTGPDLSHFLLVAQPTANLWQWISPQHSIILDSTNMELRTLYDLRVVNRIMANPNALDNGIGNELNDIIKDADLLPLKALARDHNKREYVPPRELKLLKPGAENAIYNAPRYFRMGEPVVDRLSILQSRDEGAVKAIGDQLAQFATLPNIVLYDSDADTAKIAATNLYRYYPEQDILIGHLIVDPQTQKIISSQIVKPAQTASLSMTTESTLQHHLQAIARSRQEPLEPVRDAMIALLRQQVKEPSDEFYRQMSDLLQHYYHIESNANSSARTRIADLYDHYLSGDTLTSPQEFKFFAQEHGLESFLPTQLDAGANGDGRAKEWSALMDQIQQSRSLVALDEAVTAGEQWLQKRPPEETDDASEYRVQLNKETVSQLEKLLLSSGSPLDEHSLQVRSRPILEHILTSAGITEADQKDFYLAEFDALVQDFDDRRQRTSPNR